MSASDGQQLEVECETSELGDGEVELTIRVPSEYVNPIRERIIRSFARRVSIPGFRKGKAPRALVERQIDEGRLKEELMEQVLQPAYDQSLEKAGIKALGRARLSDADLGEDGAFTFKATVTRRPEITLGEYQGLKATKHITTVTDRQVEAELERLRSRYAKFVELPADGPIEKGDLALVDYDGYVEGEKVEQASASGYPLEVGVDELFPELNQALLGARVGDTREVTTASAPESFGPEHAGKPVVYEVKAASARRREFPELDDAFAKQVSDLETMDALRQRVRENLETIGGAIADDGVRNDLTRQVCEAARLDIPSAFVSRAVDRRAEELAGELTRRGLTLSEHLQRLGRSFEDWRADLELEVRDDVRRALVLDEIGVREKIEVGDEDVHQEIHRLAERENLSEDQVQKQLSDPEQFNRLATRLYHRKVVQFLVDKAEVTEEVVEPTEDEPPAPASVQEQAQDS